MNPLLKSAAPAPELLAFMEDYRNQTDPAPFNNRERIWQSEVLFECRPFNKMIHLSSIRTYTQGEGWGSKGLQWFCSLADKHGVRIELDPYPFGSGGLSEPDLKAWYSRNGFKHYRGNLYVREPRKPLKLSPGKMKVIPMNS